MDFWDDVVYDSSKEVIEVIYGLIKFILLNFVKISFSHGFNSSVELSTSSSSKYLIVILDDSAISNTDWLWNLFLMLFLFYSF